MPTTHSFEGSAPKTVEDISTKRRSPKARPLCTDYMRHLSHKRITNHTLLSRRKRVWQSMRHFLWVLSKVTTHTLSTECDLVDRLLSNMSYITTHTPQRGVTDTNNTPNHFQANYNPQSLHGERRSRYFLHERGATKLQFTHSEWSATREP